VPEEIARKGRIAIQRMLDIATRAATSMKVAAKQRWTESGSMDIAHSATIPIASNQESAATEPPPLPEDFLGGLAGGEGLPSSRLRGPYEAGPDGAILLTKASSKSRVRSQAPGRCRKIRRQGGPGDCCGPRRIDGDSEDILDPGRQ